LKVNGKKLVDLAREGITVEREARPIEIYSLDLLPTESPCDYILTAECSGGTYIRTLCADIGAALGCGGAMASLERLEACGFSISETHTIADLEEMSIEERLSCLIPTESLFRTLPAITFPTFYERLFRSGCAIDLRKLKANLPLGARVRALSADGTFFALGEVVSENDSLAVKSIKLFVL
jgi:tRNA pseudouridine55 synthase